MTTLFISGMTFSHLAFPAVNDKMFTTEYGMRGDSVKKILIVFSDGRETFETKENIVDRALEQIQGKGNVFTRKLMLGLATISDHETLLSLSIGFFDFFKIDLNIILGLNYNQVSFVCTNFCYNWTYLFFGKNQATFLL